MNISSHFCVHCCPTSLAPSYSPSQGREVRLLANILVGGQKQLQAGKEAPDRNDQYQLCAQPSRKRNPLLRLLYRCQIIAKAASSTIRHNRSYAQIVLFVGHSDDSSPCLLTTWMHNVQEHGDEGLAIAHEVSLTEAAPAPFLDLRGVSVSVRATSLCKL